MNLVRTVITFTSIVFIGSACGSAPQIDPVHSGSELTSIKLSMPAKSAFTKSPELQKKLDAYELTVDLGNEHAPSVNCARLNSIGGGSIITMKWVDSNIQQEVKAGCHYRITLKLGTLNQIPTTAGFVNQLGSAYYKASFEVKGKDTVGKASIPVKLKMETTAEGQKAGYGEVLDSVLDISVEAPSTPSQPSLPIQPWTN